MAKRSSIVKLVIPVDGYVPSRKSSAVGSQVIADYADPKTGHRTLVLERAVAESARPRAKAAKKSSAAPRPTTTVPATGGTSFSPEAA